jgi:hypothetical protein
MEEIKLSENNLELGLTYSSLDYKEFQETGDRNLFEKVIDSLILNKYSDDKELVDYIKNLPNDKKRIAILSLLDGDNNLWSKINDRIKIGSKMDYIKDVVLMLRDFVKVGEVEKKKYGEVMTPMELVKDMLNTLPKDVWSNPNLKWLDPANGTGPFPIMVIYKLMNGLKDWEPDQEKRYKHIIENMIYTCELQDRNVFLWLCAVDPKDEYTTNTYWGSFLEEGFDKHMKEVWGLEKFDIVIGNPPYNGIFNNKNVKNLHINFFEKSFKIINKKGYLTFITPSRYVIQPEYIEFRENVQKISKDVILINKGRSFGDKASFTTIITTIFFGNGCKVNWFNSYGDTIISKVLNKEGVKLKTIRSKSLLKNKTERDEYDDQSKENHYLYFVNAKGNCKTPFRYLPFKDKKTFVKKVYLTEFIGTGNNKTLGKIYIDEVGEIGLGTDSCMYIPENNLTNLKSLYFFLSSKLLNYVINIVCQSSHVNQTMKLIVDPSKYIEIKNYSDIYNFFGLIQEEINLIESSIK